ncbi:MAG: hypothetical protein H6737_06525 [Alphaproteobacteria bacterium]|nr:hypothetical protein [Alphaproteobacteria bacterium]
MAEPDLEDSWVVEGVTWALYLAWLSALAYLALWIGIEPLPTIQARFPGAGGTVAALAVGVGFILASRYVFDVMRGAKAPAAPAPTQEPPAEPAGTAKKKRKRKKR